MATGQVKLDSDIADDSATAPGINLQHATCEHHRAPQQAGLPSPAQVLPMPIGVLSAAQNTAGARPSAVNVSTIVPIQTLKYMTMKTQPPSTQQSKLFETYSDHIDVFLVEVYRCKLCRFHTAAKSVISSHMLEKHFDSNHVDSTSTTTTTRPTPTPNNFGRGTQSSGENTVVHVNETQATSSMSINMQTSVDTPVIPQLITSSRSDGQIVTIPTHQAKQSPPINSSATVESDNLNKSHPIAAASAVNALELLMGIGNKGEGEISAADLVIPVQLTTTRSAETGKQNLHSNAANPESVSTEVLGEDLMATLKVETSQSQGRLTTVDEEELAQTLKIDEKRDSGGESNGDVDDDVDSNHGDDDDDDDDDNDGLMEEEVAKPTPVQIGLGLSQMSNIDIQEIANTASKSNPKATTITVLHHGRGDDPPTAIQFRKSRRSQAVIPTGESLGIASPFGQRPYRGHKKFSCTTCGARYKLRSDLDRHIHKKHKRLREFLCEICGEALATRAGVKYHVSKKHMNIKQLYQCSDCDYNTSYEARMVIHRATHDSNFYCKLCEKKFVSAERLNKHFSSPLHKNALNPLVCEHCGYSTKKKDNFVVHMRKHTGEKPYKCKICSYASSDGSTLKKHVMAKHSSIRPFKCAMCTFSCVDKKGLDIHIRKHTGERPFKCKYCQYAAKRRSALNIHMQTHDKDNLYIHDAVIETVGQVIIETSNHTPIQTTLAQEQQFTTMSNYQPPPTVTQRQIVQPAGNTSAAGPASGGIDSSYNAQIPTGSAAKPVQTMWQNI
ncbi:zinc finger protein 652-B-like [Asterias rubens]|uniref:zinc finger protein 652-B-like n=1 Tax=Asterias rubens TaxID=7604 RepID=UPI001454ED1F|nr:zinc finger protein 652-B-like [Asterias rubens]